MTATNGKGGLVPVSSKIAADWNAKYRTYPMASSYGTAIFYGDVVTLNAGNIERSAFGFTAGTAEGVFLGCKYTNPTTKTPTWSMQYPATTVASDIQAFICDDINAVFEVQADGPLTAAALGKNIDLAQTTAGSATTGKSGLNASAASIAVTATLRFRVVGLKQSPDNAWTDAFPIILVKFNTGFHADGVALGI